MTVLRGRPRGSTAFTSNSVAPRLTAPLPQGSQAVIPATQPQEAQAQGPPEEPPTPVGSSIIVASQPVRGPVSRGRGGRAPARNRGNGNVRPSIQREASQWEGVALEGSQITAIGGGQALSTPGNRGNTRGKARAGARKASGSQKASATAGIAKNTRSGGRTTRSSQPGNAGTA